MREEEEKDMTINMKNTQTHTEEGYENSRRTYIKINFTDLIYKTKREGKK